MIRLENVFLRYPVMDLTSHSFQAHMSGAIGGIIGKQKGAVSHVEALADISFNLNDGERLGIIGHNGAGKTSLLRVLSGVYPVTSGSIEVQGKISALTDFTLGMDPNASGLKNIVFRLTFMGYSFTEANKVIDEIVDFSDLGEFINMPVRTYSTGMFLRLAFAISTHFSPDILILDEVIGAGDESFRKKAAARLDELIEKSRIVILSSHDLASVERYCDKAILMSHGAVIQSGSPSQVSRYYLDLHA